MGEKLRAKETHSLSQVGKVRIAEIEGRITSVHADIARLTYELDELITERVRIEGYEQGRAKSPGA